jgi:hypothetical protein
MRSTAIAATIFSVGLCMVHAGTGQAAEISDQGAGDIHNALTHSLSRDLARSGFVTVKPAGDHYELTYNFDRFFDKLNSSVLAITGFKPTTIELTPQTGGGWNAKGDGPFAVSLHTPTMDAAYTIASNSFNGVFDPKVGIFRSLNATQGGLRLSGMGTGALAGHGVEAAIDSGSFTGTATAGSTPGKINLQSQTTMKGFRETIKEPNRPDGRVLADSVDSNANVTDVSVKEIQALARFVIVHFKAKNLSMSGRQKFAELIREALPVFGRMDQTFVFHNMTIETPGGTIGLKALQYDIGLSGLSRASDLKFGVRLDHVAAAAAPPAYQAFLPDVVDVQLAAADINLDQAVGSATAFLTEKSGRRPGDAVIKALFPDGKASLNIAKADLVSGIYDIEASGVVNAQLGKKPLGLSMQATILARDIDKTIAAVQVAAKSDPKLNQLSFMLMAAKGFAKTDPDGRLRWEVAMDENRTVTVNGQIIKRP